MAIILLYRTPMRRARRRIIHTLFIFSFLVMFGATFGAVTARWLEGSLLLVHAAAYLAVVATVLPLGQAVAFVAVQQGVFGLYMGISFAPNHKGMPMERPEDHWDYLRRQVITARNVKGGPFVDRFLGGLNYQIEHHLFPSMPRPSLKRAQPLVRAFCAERGVPYVESNLVQSYRQALSHLHDIGTQPASTVHGADAPITAKAGSR